MLEESAKAGGQFVPDSEQASVTALSRERYTL